MHVHIKIADQGWILERMGRELAKRSDYITVDTDTNKYADIQYYITYSARRQKVSPIEFAYFTHLESDVSAARRFFDVARAVDFCVCQSDPAETALLAEGISNLTVISPGVELERFQPIVRVGVIGRTYHTGRKGEHLVAQVMDIPGIEWSFTGVGWPGPALHIPDEGLPDFYRSLDYVLVPSLNEGGPMCVLEALACGVPVIAPAIGWVTKFPHIEYRTGDAADLRRVLSSVVKAKQDLHRSVESYSWQSFADKHHALFERYRPHIQSSRKQVWPVSRENGQSSLQLPRSLTATLLMHGAERNSKGGPSIRVPETAEGLRSLGVDAHAKFFPDTDLDADIVHVFNVWQPDTALAALTAARRLGRVTIFSPIYLDLSLRKLWHDEIVAAFRNATDKTQLPETLSAIRQQVAEAGKTEAFDLPEPIPGYYSKICELTSSADHLIFLSEAERRRLAKVTGVQLKGTMIRNPVARPDFDDPDLFRQKYGLHDYVLCVGRIETRKNQLMLAYALKDSGIPLVLIGHCGDQFYLDEIKRLKAPNLHIIDRLPPGSNILASAFAGARVFVLPSWAEGAPLAALEAASFGIPLVLSGLSGEEEYFGEYARYCNPADPADICHQTLAAYQVNVDTSQRRAQSAHFLTEFSYEKYCVATLSLYKEIYERTSRGKALRTAASAPRASGTHIRTDRRRIFFDLTTSAHSRDRMTGITRVEQKLAEFLPLNDDADVTFCCWRPADRLFLRVEHGTTAPDQVKKLVESKGTFPASELQLIPGTDYFLAGSAWMQNSAYARAVVDCCRNHGMRLNVLIYDLIPIKFPFWFAPGYTETFKQNLQLLLDQADRLMAISQATKKNLISFCERTLGTRPDVAVIDLGDDFAECSSRELARNTNLGPDVAALNLPKRFILCVGAIHPRKNHHLLYNCWLRIKEEMGSSTPHLVIVGGASWGGEWLLRSFEGDERINDYVRVIDGIDDALLDELYERSLFTVYPSLYEGWGLPVAESLRRGKICLASDIPSIREIVSDRRDLLDPLDSRAWAARIAMYAIGKTARENREAEIRASYKDRSWRKTVAQIAHCMGNAVPDRVSTVYAGEIVDSNRIASLFARALPSNEAEVILQFRPVVRADRDLELFLCTRRTEEAPINWQLAVNGQPILDWMSEGTQARVIAAHIPRALVRSAGITHVNMAPLSSVPPRRISNSRSRLLEITKLAIIEEVETSARKSSRHLSRRAQIIEALNERDQQREKSSEDQRKVNEELSLSNPSISYVSGRTVKRQRKERRTLKRAIKRILKVIRSNRKS